MKYEILAKKIVELIPQGAISDKALRQMYAEGLFCEAIAEYWLERDGEDHKGLRFLVCQGRNETHKSRATDKLLRQIPKENVHDSDLRCIVHSGISFEDAETAIRVLVGQRALTGKNRKAAKAFYNCIGIRKYPYM